MMHIARLKERAIALGIMNDEEATEFFADLKEHMSGQPSMAEELRQFQVLLDGVNKMNNVLSGMLKEIHDYASNAETEWEPVYKVLKIIENFDPQKQEPVTSSDDFATLENENVELWSRNAELANRLFEVCRAYSVYEDDLVEGTKSPVLINGKLAVSVRRAAGTFESVMELTKEIERKSTDEA